jgi:hypothetical protein
MPDYITECTRCGCREFCVTETLDWDGEVDDTGLINCKSSGSTIENIHCAACGAPYSSECFANFEFE